jgi:dienelactone hydrolase
MTGEHDPQSNPPCTAADLYDPFTRGHWAVGVRTIEVLDTVRDRRFPCELWYPAAAQHAGQDLAAATQDVFTDAPNDPPRRQLAVRNAAAQPGTYPLIVFSHNSGGRRRQSTFLCTHLSSHGYVVAALTHSEVVTPQLRRREGETGEERTARVAAWIANRVPDVRFLLNQLLGEDAWEDAWKADVTFDPMQIGAVGHSFGGWTVLATLEVDPRIRAIVALAPGGSSNPPPDVIPAQLTFAWGRDVPTLYLVAADDSALPLAGMYDIFERTQATRRMFILDRADHEHFADEFEQQAELCSPEQAHLFVRGLTLCHLDAVLRQKQAAQRFWRGDVAGELAARGIEGIEVIVPDS